MYMYMYIHNSIDCLTKKFCVLFFTFVLKDKIVLIFLNRPASCCSLNSTQCIDELPHHFYII